MPQRCATRHGETYQEFLIQLWQAAGIDTPRPGASQSEAEEDGLERRLDASARPGREDREDE